MVVYGLWFTLLLCGCCTKSYKEQNLPPIEEDFEDEDVKAERERVNACVKAEGGDRDIILVQDLVKKYEKKEKDAKDENQQETARTGRPLNQSMREPEVEKKEEDKGTVAVKGTSFGVKQGECFALLGINGAGKSSTFNCLTAYDVASGGLVMLDGNNVKKYYTKPFLMHDLVGYCP